MIECISENNYSIEYIDFLISFNINPDILFIYDDKIEIFFFDKESDNYSLNLNILSTSNDFDNMESIKILNSLNLIKNSGYSEVLILEKRNISLYDLFYFTIKINIDELRDMKLFKLMN
jgi:hypothetical protein